MVIEFSLSFFCDVIHLLFFCYLAEGGDISSDLLEILSIFSFDQNDSDDNEDEDCEMSQESESFENYRSAFILFAYFFALIEWVVVDDAF